MSSANPTLAHQFRLLTNKVLSRFGFELVRSARQFGNSEEIVTFNLGRYRLQIPGNNSLWREYQKNPEYTAQLGRLAARVFAKYPDAYAMDIGANIGDTAAILRTAMAAPIVCVEGDSAVFPMLESNLRQLAEVTAHQCFLGEQTETLRVVAKKEGWDTTLIPSDHAEDGIGKSVAVQSLDDFSNALGVPGHCKLLKLDIEGFDLRVLRGATRLLARDQPAILFEFNHHNLSKLQEDDLRIFPYLESLGYSDLCFHDAQGHFLQPCKVHDTTLLSDLLDYARTVEGMFYYDICAFHAVDSQLASSFIASERGHRKSLVAQRAPDE